MGSLTPAPGSRSCCCLCVPDALAKFLIHPISVIEHLQHVGGAQAVNMTLCLRIQDSWPLQETDQQANNHGRERIAMKRQENVPSFAPGQDSFFLLY